MINNLTANLRLYLWGALAILLFYNYQAWMRDYAPPPESVAATPAPAGASPPTAPGQPDLASHVPDATKGAPAAGAHHDSGAGAPSAAASAGSAAAPPATPADAAAAAPVVHVRTDVLDVEISTQGGTLQRADLLAYPKVKGESVPVRLENHDDPQTTYLLQSGLNGPLSTPYPTQSALYSSEKSDYALDGATELRVPLTWSEDGVTVARTYIFKRGDYRIRLEYAVHNGGATAWEARPYAQIVRNDPPTSRSYFNVE
ncbi:MAG TPA: membrane protein insertase YidC, partial [Steroidobacteraceae bacterium]|nr:membrane protein insertase YidC [Steroidobacteraceae bacterium]